MNALLLVAGYSNDVLVNMVLDAGADANATNDFCHSALHIVVVGKWSQIRGLTSGRMGGYGLNRRNIDFAMKEWAQKHRDLTRGREDEKQMEKVGQFIMEIGSRYCESENAEEDDDQEAMKKRVEAVWRYREDNINSQKSSKKPGVLDNLLSCGGKRSKQAKHSASNVTSKPLSMNDRYNTNDNISPEKQREISDITERCSKILRMIIDAGCEIDKVEKTFGMTALDMAILFGDMESTVILMSAGGDPFHLLKMFSLSDLFEGIVNVDKKRVKEVLAYDTDVDVNQQFSAFNTTVRHDDGKAKNIVSDGLTPLSVAAQMSDVGILDVIKMLQKHGLNLLDINKK